MSELSEKMGVEEQQLKERFNAELGPEPARAQAIAMFGIYHVVNTLARYIIKATEDLDVKEIL